MHHLERFKFATRTTAAAAMAAALITASCGGSDSASSATTNSKASKRPPVRTLPVTSPCDWLTTSEVEQTLGKLTGPPVARRNMRSRPTANAEYDAGGPCVYSISAPNGKPVQVIVSVDPSGATGIEIASNMLGASLSKELSACTGAKRRTDGWDFVGGVG